MSNSLKVVFSSLIVAMTFVSSVSHAKDLPFFGGNVIAKTTWTIAPKDVKHKAQLKIELFNKAGQILDLDPSLIAVGLLMPEMPAMGVDQQSVGNLSDASGNPVIGVYIVSDMAFSMPGKWAAEIQITDSVNPKLSEKKQILLDVAP